VGIVSDVAASPQIITFGALASTAFSALMGVMACGKVLQAIARDNLLPALDFFAQGTEHSDTPTCEWRSRSDEGRRADSVAAQTPWWPHTCSARPCSSSIR
jgi:hypothetical protein